MEKKTIEIDAEKLKWRDIVFIDEWDGNPQGKVRRIGEMVCRLVVGMTEAELDDMEMDEVAEVFEALQAASAEALPKVSESDSPTS